MTSLDQRCWYGKPAIVSNSKVRLPKHVPVVHREYHQAAVNSLPYQLPNKAGLNKDINSLINGFQDIRLHDAGIPPAYTMHNYFGPCLAKASGYSAQTPQRYSPNYKYSYPQFNNNRIFSYDTFDNMFQSFHEIPGGIPRNSDITRTRLVSERYDFCPHPPAISRQEHLMANSSTFWGPFSIPPPLPEYHAITSRRYRKALPTRSYGDTHFRKPVRRRKKGDPTTAFMISMALQTKFEDNGFNPRRDPSCTPSRDNIFLSQHPSMVLHSVPRLEEPVLPAITSDICPEVHTKKAKKVKSRSQKSKQNKKVTWAGLSAEMYGKLPSAKRRRRKSCRSSLRTKKRSMPRRQETPSTQQTKKPHKLTKRRLRKLIVKGKHLIPAEPIGGIQEISTEEKEY